MLRACSEACISDDQSPEVAIRRRRMISWHRGGNRVIRDVTTWLKDVRAYAAKGEAPGSLFLTSLLQRDRILA